MRASRQDSSKMGADVVDSIRFPPRTEVVMTSTDGGSTVIRVIRDEEGDCIAAYINVRGNEEVVVTDKEKMVKLTGAIIRAQNAQLLKQYGPEVAAMVGYYE